MKAFSSACFSGVSGGMALGLRRCPWKTSGMRTGAPVWAARMSAPWRVCGAMPKMSYSPMMPTEELSVGPVMSVGEGEG